VTKVLNQGYKVNDRYEILKLLGEGGMANVYLALDTILDREVAVKVLRGDLSNDEKFVRRFQREAISSSSLSHPNIVEMYDVGEDQGHYYIVMEYIKGKTLKSLIKKRVYLSIHEVIDIMTQLTKAIANAHESYIIHRDIKPQNVMILDNGLVKITDFGIATLTNQMEMTHTNSIMGSVHYLPPEQANGGTSTVKSDVYSLGILMYELLVGKVPFKGETAVEIALKHIKEEIPSVRKIKPDVPQSIENIIIKACAKNPKNRYSNANEMLADLYVCLDEDKQNAPRHIYENKEHEEKEEKQKTLINIPKIFLPKEPAGENVKKEEKINKKLIVLMSTIVIAMAVMLTFLVIIYPSLSRVKEVKIPSVENLTREQAIKKLEDLGLKVSDESLKASDKVDEGLIIGTYPGEGIVVKVGRGVVLYVSTGTSKIKLENYINRNFEVAEAALLAKGMKIQRDYIDVEYKENMDYEKIVNQTPLAGEDVTTGQTITLYTAKPMYPDFVGEGFTLNQIETFLNRFDVNMIIAYLETDTITSGSVVSQSVAKHSLIWPNQTVTITVAVIPYDDIEPDNLIVD
jgi:serine/threonine protein kinase